MNVDVIKNGKRQPGHLVMLQLMGSLPDGKLMFAAGEDDNSFHVEDGDKFYTAVFVVNPFEA